jgi:multisubunit Na+/H+ antiporter MnhG subunit
VISSRAKLSHRNYYYISHRCQGFLASYTILCILHDLFLTLSYFRLCLGSLFLTFTAIPLLRNPDIFARVLICTAKRISFILLFILGYMGMVHSRFLVVFFLFQGHFIVFICCLLVPLFWDIVLCFCMALRSKRTGETVDDTSGTEHARYFGIYRV